MPGMNKDHIYLSIYLSIYLIIDRSITKGKIIFSLDFYISYQSHVKVEK